MRAYYIQYLTLLANTWQNEGPDHLQALGILAIAVWEPGLALMTSDLLLLLMALDQVILVLVEWEPVPGLVWPQMAPSLVSFDWLTLDLRV